MTSRGGSLYREQAKSSREGIRKYPCFTFIMADPAEEVPAAIEDEEPEETPGYKAPAQKTLDEIKNLDADDESLVKYKQQLLGAGAAASGKSKVIS